MTPQTGARVQQGAALPVSSKARPPAHSPPPAPAQASYARPRPNPKPSHHFVSSWRSRPTPPGRAWPHCRARPSSSNASGAHVACPAAACCTWSSLPQARTQPPPSAARLATACSACHAARAQPPRETASTRSSVRTPGNATCPCAAPCPASSAQPRKLSRGAEVVGSKRQQV